jgi:hypothetical protein
MLRQSNIIESNQAPEAAMSSASISAANRIKRLSAAERPGAIFLLKDNDVLSGRGSIINKHVGNRRFRRLITANKEAYAKCEKNSHKFFLALSIVIAIERKGGRFMKKRDEKIDDSCFIAICRKDSVAKTAQALRDQLQGTPNRRRRSSASSVERLIEAKKSMKVDRLQQNEMDEQSRQSEGACVNDDDTSSSDDTSIDDSHEVLPIDRAAEPFTGFAELLAASSTMNPQQQAPSSSLSSQQQSALRRHFYHQSRGFPQENCLLVGVERATFQHVAQPVEQRTAFGPHASGNGKIWVPQELEALIMSDPDAVEALAALR